MWQHIWCLLFNVPLNVDISELIPNIETWVQAVEKFSEFSSNESFANRKRLICIEENVAHAKLQVGTSVTNKNSPNVYKICPKIISLEKWKILTTFQKLPKNVGSVGKIIDTKGFEKLPKVQKIAQSGHTGWNVVATKIFWHF